MFLDHLAGYGQIPVSWDPRQIEILAVPLALAARSVRIAAWINMGGHEQAGA